MASLEQGVLDEGQAGLVGIADTEAALSDHLETAVGEHLVEFNEFARVAAGENDTLHKSTSRPAPKRRAARRPARQCLFRPAPAVRPSHHDGTHDLRPYPGP